MIVRIQMFEVRPKDDIDYSLLGFYDEKEKIEHRDFGRLFREMRAAYGRCESKVCYDRKAEPPSGTKSWKSVHIGWVFRKREQYTDCNKNFLKETRITLYEDPAPTRYVEIEGGRE